MAKETPIQWCDSTANPTMGCDGCELWNSRAKICYAGHLHQRHGGTNKGYSPKFEILTQYPGRMAKAAAWWPDLRGTDRTDKPWMNGLPRLIFVSDMSDALSKDVPFEFLKTEIVDVANSPAGKRHQWLWLTKQAGRMASFDQWLLERFTGWPANLWAGTSITRQATTPRLDNLVKLRAPIKFVSVEPQWEEIDLRPWLHAIQWVIGGGQSGHDALEYDLNWGRSLINQCANFSVPYFQKQLGANVGNETFRLKFKDSHGGDWNEWPADLRVRQFPKVMT